MATDKKTVENLFAPIKKVEKPAEEKTGEQALNDEIAELTGRMLNPVDVVVKVEDLEEPGETPEPAPAETEDQREMRETKEKLRREKEEREKRSATEKKAAADKVIEEVKEERKSYAERMMEMIPGLKDDGQEVEVGVGICSAKGYKFFKEGGATIEDWNEIERTGPELSDFLVSMQKDGYRVSPLRGIRIQLGGSQQIITAIGHKQDPVKVGARAVVYGRIRSKKFVNFTCFNAAPGQ